MANISEVEPFIRPYVGNCPVFEIDRQSRMAARKFFQSTRTWSLTSKQTLRAGKSRLVIPIDDAEEIIHIKSMRIVDGNFLGVAPSADRFGELRIGIPTAYALEEDWFQFSSIADVDYKVISTITLKPSIDASVIPDEIMSRWLEAIQYCCIYQLCSMPNKEWTDLNTASIFKGRYKREVTRARNSVTSGYTEGNIAIQQRPIA